MTACLTLDLLRHGACDDGEIYRGSTDSVLSAQGWTQITGLFDQLEHSVCGYDAIYSSPLQRCQQPARQLASRLRLPLQTDARLRELCFGDWDGQPCQQVWQQDQAKVLAFWSDPDSHPPPNGETLLSLQQRLTELLQQLLREHQGGDQKLLCISHGGVIRTLCCLLLGWPLSSGQKFDLDYGSLTRIQLYPDQSDPVSADNADPCHAQLVFINRLSRIEDYRERRS